MPKKNIFAAIGNFDGLHSAHRDLIKRMQDSADDMNADKVIITFEPHPLALLSDSKPFLLTLPEEKERLVDSCFAIDKIITLNFSKDFAQLSPHEFISTMLASKYDIRHVFVGYNFTFGKHGAGKAYMLQDMCAPYDIGVTVLPPIECLYGVISSSLIREFISNGNISEANMMLGYWYNFTGIIEKGNQYGRVFGFPTANIRLPIEKQLPPFGVYVARAEIKGETFNAIANLGIKPTVSNNGQLLLETHVFGLPDNDLYGNKITVYLDKMIRQEKKFTSHVELQNEIQDNILTAKKLLFDKHNKEHLIKTKN